MSVQLNIHSMDIVLMLLIPQCNSFLSGDKRLSTCNNNDETENDEREKKTLCSFHCHKKANTKLLPWVTPVLGNTSGTLWKTTGLGESAELQPPHYDSEGHCEESSWD